jgi:hypothetical protein
MSEKKWGIDPENVKLIEYNLLVNQGAESTVGASEVKIRVQRVRL